MRLPEPPNPESLARACTVPGMVSTGGNDRGVRGVAHGGLVLSHLLLHLRRVLLHLPPTKACAPDRYAWL